MPHIHQLKTGLMPIYPRWIGWCTTSWLFECFSIKVIIFWTVSSGRLELWPPFTNSKYLFFPWKFSYNFTECWWSIRASSSPIMKIRHLVGGIFLTSSSIFKSSRSKSAFYLISDFSLWKTHGKRHPIMQLGMLLGLFLVAYSLQSFFIDLNDESATIISTFPYLRALAAPILLPHKITSKCCFLSSDTTVEICSDSLTPSEIELAYWLFPQPRKSKAPRLYPAGKYFMRVKAYNLEEEFPCRYRMILWLMFSGLMIVRSMFLPSCLMICSWRW